MHVLAVRDRQPLVLGLLGLPDQFGHPAHLIL